MLSDPSNIVIILIGLILLMKKSTEMDRYIRLRVLILTLILSFIVLYGFLQFGFTLDAPVFCEPEHFCMSEM